MAPVDKVTIRYADEETATTVPRKDWLAVDPEVLQKAESQPDQFRPSMRVLPGGSHPLPDDAEPLAAGLELPAGAPLLLDLGGTWKNVRVSADKGDMLNVIYSWHRSFNRDHKRSALAIRRETLDELKKPGAADRYAEMLEEQTLEEQDEDDITVSYVDKWDVKQTATYHIFDKDYPISVRVPRGAQQLPEGLEIPVGTPVAYCWARKWHHATLLRDRQATVLFKEDDSAVSFAYKVPREHVIIQDKILRKIRNQRGKRLKELQQLLRTWTDATGQHKIEARFLSLEDDVVTLKTNADREVKLPLERLSEEDQELLKDVGPATDNPFE